MRIINTTVLYNPTSGAMYTFSMYDNYIAPDSRDTRVVACFAPATIRSPFSENALCVKQPEKWTTLYRSERARARIAQLLKEGYNLVR